MVLEPGKVAEAVLALLFAAKEPLDAGVEGVDELVALKLQRGGVSQERRSTARSEQLTFDRVR